ncbi:fatty acid desaturase family protein [Sanguibacter antarcticus]|uniref:Fatty acid desaturase n=1 Tax=Sanguibacter antarcticus TaxID=372484 RepID=A0A2A9E890_9MICO|nr:acyl-CoA desaturase [Sanguibacter antarcticus]PFG34525.1 fatty acid desaturase [Sanguibacter antarcticus]
MSATLTLPDPSVPPESPRVRAVTDFAEISRRIQDAGLMRRRYAYYWAKLVGMVVVWAALITAFVLVGDSWWQLATAVVAAVVMTQTAFLGHDAAHRQMFVSGKWNEWTSLVVANLFVGLSYGWWQHKHTRHHGNPNKEDVDPDIDLPVLAFTATQAASRRNPFTRWFAAHQGYFFFPLLLLEGIDLHYQGLKRVFGREPIARRGVEILFLGTRLVGYVVLVFAVLSPVKAVVFIALHLALFGLYMGGSFAPNHKGMPIVPKDLKIDFLRRQVLMSRNVTGGRFVDVALGGLNYQIEHHLFPSMPRISLRRAQPIIAAFCAEKDVKYTQTTLFTSYGIVIRYLNEVGLGARDNFTCPLVQSYR